MPLPPRSSALQEIVAVLGCPAAGESCQYVFERAITEAGLDWRCVTFDVPLGRAEDALRGVRALGFRGCMLSGPLRQAAIAHVDSASPTAAFSGALSMIERQPHGLVGHMTDGRGAVEAIRSHFDPSGASVLLLGAGTAAAAVALELSLAGVGEVIVANRSPERAAMLADRLRSIGTVGVETAPWEPAKPLAIPERVGLVVSAIPSIWKPAVELAGLRGDLVVADLALGSQRSPILAQAARHGACVVDGIEIHCERLAIDFKQLTGAEADTDVLREALEEFLAA